jgi:DNA primase
VREAADLVEIVSGYTDLRRRGGRFVGLCPFHDERTPSFSVDPASKLYYCFGCQEGGDVFRFLLEKEGLEFRAAVEQLADRYGVELALESADPREEERRRARERQHDLLAKTAEGSRPRLGTACS